MAEKPRPFLSRRDVGISLFGNLFAAVLGFAANVILQRSLNREGSGWFENLSLIILLAEIVLGLRASALLGMLQIGDSPRSYPRVLCRVLAFYLPAVLVLGVAGTWGGMGEVRSAGWVAGVLLAAPGLLLLHQMVLVGARAMQAYLASILLEQGIFCAGLLVLLPSHPTVLTALGVRAASSVAGLVLAVPATYYALGRMPEGASPAPDRPRAGAWIRCTFLNLAHTVACRAEILLLTTMAGAAVAGDYRISLLVGTLFMMLPSALSNLILPRVAFAASRPHPSASLSVIRYSGMFLGILAVMTAALAPWGIPRLFGPQYVGAVGPCLWRLPGIWAFAMHLTLLSDVTARHRYPLFACLSLVALCTISLGGSVLLVPRMGANGAAIAFSLGSWISLIWLAMGHARAEGLGWRDFLKERPPVLYPVTTKILA